MTGRGGKKGPATAREKAARGCSFAQLYSGSLLAVAKTYNLDGSDGVWREREGARGQERSEKPGASGACCRGRDGEPAQAGALCDFRAGGAARRRRARAENHRASF
jgi:hypothetical protein